MKPSYRSRFSREARPDPPITLPIVRFNQEQAPVIYRPKSKYDLAKAWTYLRLAYQSMSKDQEEATQVVDEVKKLATPEARILALAKIIAATRVGG